MQTPWLYLIQVALFATFFLAQPLWAQAQGPSRVTTAVVGEMELSARTRLVGIVDFDRVSALATEISGLIAEQKVEEGQGVSAGEILLSLNTDLMEKDIQIKKRELDQLQAELRKLSAQRKRFERLMKQDSTSQQAFEEALYDQQALLARRSATQIELDRLQLQATKSQLRAPFDGIVLERFKTEGDWLAPGDPALRLASTDHVVVKVAISESLSRFQQPGSRLPVRIDALDLDLEGIVQGLPPVADLRSRTLTLKLAIPYQAGLAANLSAQVEVPSALTQKVRTVPRDAIVTAAGTEQVFIVENGKAKAIALQVTARDGDRVSVSNSELRAGMQVVMDGNTRLQAGADVQVVVNP